MPEPADRGSRRMRIGFAGTPEFAAVALRRLLAEDFDVGMVLTQPDRPAGRGMKLQPSAVKAVALEHHLPLSQPHSLRLDGKYPDDARAAREALRAARIEALVVAAYGLILPKWVLELPRRGCLNIHGSLLPRWRGAAPIHRAIEAGDEHSGVTIMQMDEGLDTGDMLLWQQVPIAASETTASLHDRLAALGAELVVRALRDAQGNRPTPVPQPTEGVTYAHKVDKTEAAIRWTDSAVQIERRVRAFDPFPGAYFLLRGEAVKVWHTEVVPGVAGARPGTVLRADAKGLVVACGDGALRITQVQRPGGRRVEAAALVQGQPELAGLALSDG